MNFLSDELLSRLEKCGRVEKRKRGELIFGERENLRDIYLVLEGYVSLFRDSRYGDTKMIMICSAGELLNEVVLEKEKASVSASALSDVCLLCVEREAFAELMEEDPKVMRAVFDSLSHKTRRLYHQVGNANGTYPLEKRLAAKIVKLSRDYGVETPKGLQIDFRVTVTMLANMTGAKRETVSRVISQFRKAGYLCHEDGILIITDVEGLKSQI